MPTIFDSIASLSNSSIGSIRSDGVSSLATSSIEPIESDSIAFLPDNSIESNTFVYFPVPILSVLTHHIAYKVVSL